MWGAPLSEMITLGLHDTLLHHQAVMAMSA